MKVYRIIDSTGHVGYAAGAAGGFRRIKGELFGKFQVTDDAVKPARILAPLDPVNIFAIGLNYRAHAIETHKPIPEAPVVFAKATTALNNPGDPIVLPACGPDSVDYECELAVVVGRRCRDVKAADALNYVLGYTVANDVSARDWQAKLMQWVRAKSFDSFCPLGPCIETEIDPSDLHLTTRLNGRLMQDSRTSDLIFNVPQLIEFLSSDLTLLPGTVILTGTPSGVGVARDPQVFLHPGDTVTCAIDGIGELTNPVAAAGR